MLIAGLPSLGNTIGIIGIPWTWIGDGVLPGFVLGYAPEWFGKKYVCRKTT